VIPRKFQRLTPMFPESGNAERLLGILSYVWVCRKSKMAAIVYDTNSQACTPQTPEVSIIIIIIIIIVIIRNSAAH